MKTIQLRCKAFSGERTKINKIQIDDEGVVRVWDDVAGHFTKCHSLSARTIGKIGVAQSQNNTLRPIDYRPPTLQVEAR